MLKLRAGAKELKSDVRFRRGFGLEWACHQAIDRKLRKLQKQMFNTVCSKNKVSDSFNFNLI